MKKYLTLLTLVLIISLFSAKRGSENFTGFETGHISFSCNYLPSSVSVINSYVDNFGLDKFDDFILTWGGELTGNVNSNISTGIQYYTGWNTTQKIVDVLDTNSTYIKLDRCIDYSISYYGLILNYRKSFTGNIEYFGSFSGNYGNIELIISQDEGDQRFDDMFGSYSPLSNINEYNRSSSIRMSLWMFTISSGIKFYFSDRVAIGGSIGYTYGLVNDSGTLNNEFETINGVPNLDFDGFTYSVSLYFGS
ncbi:MAG: hypothetical protein KAH33_03840 [Candidatus Delongbacteria bacterium]|nr:hypothetical protein [Candidatus Delongbacteria bacterium]